MIAFHHNIFFIDESAVEDERFNAAFESIDVSESGTHEFVYRSEWMEISGRQVRYLSDTAFANADRSFLWGMEIDTVVTLQWDAGQRRILYAKEKGYRPEYLRFWVLHTFLPLVFELERRYRILHVGSVLVEEKPILFSAFSFGGKSTMTDYFLRQGHPLLSDDSLGIEKREDGYYAIPSYPFHRPYREVEALGFHTENFAPEPRPLHAVFTLKQAAPDADVRIDELKGIEKFKAFHYSSFIDFDFMKRERFTFFTEMAKAVPVYRVNVPWDLARLPEVYDAIVTKAVSG